MNDTADEPSKPTSAGPKYQKISDKCLRRILADHKQWLAAEDKAGHVQADLSFADLRGRDLHGANLRKSILISANFERLAVTEDGKPGQERSADVTDADFRDADLSNAQLSTVTGLRAEMLAGAVLTNAKLPKTSKNSTG